MEIFTSYSTLLANSSQSTANREKSSDLQDAKAQNTDSLYQNMDEIDISVHAHMRARLNGLQETLTTLDHSLEMLDTASEGIEIIDSLIDKVRKHAASSRQIDSPEQKKSLQIELSTLIGQINRVASTTSYHDEPLLNGQFSRSSINGSMWIQVGPNRHQRERIFLKDMSAEASGLQNPEIIDITSPASLQKIEDAATRADKSKADLDAYHNRLLEVKRHITEELKIIKKALEEFE